MILLIGAAIIFSADPATAREDGPSLFVPSTENLGSSAIAMAAGDIDGDTYADLIFGNGNDRIYINNGDGTFAFYHSFSDDSGGHGRCLRLADLDLDGDLDLLEGIAGYPFGYPDTEVRIFANNGTGLFTTPTSIVLSRPPAMYYDGSQFLPVADLDMDQDPDIVASFRDTSQAEVYTNDGSGIFVLSQTLPSSYVKSSAVGDLDADGDPDMVLGNSENAPNKVFINNGTGTFIDSGQTLGTSYTYHVALGDLDGDDDLDLITANINKPNNVWLNDGTGIFSLGYSFGTSNGYSHPVLIEDVDHDVDLDVITAGDTTYVYLNDGLGQLSSSQVLAGTYGLNGDAALVDVDSDLDLDLVTAGMTNALYYNVLDPFALIVSPDPLLVGQNTAFTVTNGLPNSSTWLVYSLAGPGSTWIPFLNVYLDIASPKKAFGPTQTNGSGSVGWNATIPSGAAGLDVWLQSVQYGQTTNVVETSVQ